MQTNESLKECIRVFADIDQLNNCRKRLHELDSSFSKISNALSLAGNNVRLKILFLLFEEQKLCVCDLSDILSMKIPAVSQHLRKLKDGGVIDSSKAGQTIFYFLNTEYADLFKSYFTLIASNKVLETVR
ncbi:MAG: winged helix-turn-helix transcriptional regulator [Bacteroidetes bacterium]|nr:winged helix-turn-helix transcriptional regulator [Bacteroidota bacterium]